MSGLGEGGRERQTLPFRPKATHMLEIPVCTGYLKKKIHVFKGFYLVLIK